MNGLECCPSCNRSLVNNGVDIRLGNDSVILRVCYDCADPARFPMVDIQRAITECLESQREPHRTHR